MKDNIEIYKIKIIKEGKISMTWTQINKQIIKIQKIINNIIMISKLINISNINNIIIN